jgi:uncharacterized Ntn-hydrolase superfamily protein
VTFSIVAADPVAQECGVAVASRFLAVGSAVPWAAAGVGAIATQSYANTGYGPSGLAMLADGIPPAAVVERLTATDPEAAKRQLGIVDMQGRAATFSGQECFPWVGGLTAANVAVQGNILVGEATISAMLQTFQSAGGALSWRLLAALKAGERAGGDRRGKQSAALLVVKPRGGYGGFNDRYLDLRVDDHPRPVVELERVAHLWQLYYEKPAEDQLVTIDGHLAEELRDGLRRLGFDPGLSGPWSDQDQKAFRAFSEIENLEDRLRPDQRTDQQVLGYFRQRVRGHAER